MPPAACAPAAEYLRLLDGELPPDAADRLGGHLDRCPECAAAVRTLVARDTLGDSLRGFPPPPAAPPGLLDLLLALPAAAPDPIDGVTDGPTPGPRGDDTAFVPDGMRPPAAHDEVGRLGDYRVLGDLGRGGMGVVYRAEDVRLERPAAVKVMRPELARDPAARARFLAEARAAARVRSDHVVTVYQAGEEGETAFVAMELLAGEPLDRWLAARPAVPLAEVVRIGREAALGLAAAHAHRLVHRDVKPGNIWVEESGRVKLLDFGLVRAADGGPDPLVVGTPAFMAPEQAAGGAVDYRADLFGLGCVLYRLATGRFPFPPEPGARTPPPPAHAVNPAVPPRLSALIARLLADDPAGRPASARAVAEELAAVLAPPRRPRRFAVAAAVALVAAAAAATFVLATPAGTLLVEVDAAADVRFRQGKLEVYDEAGVLRYTLEPSEKNKTLPVGKYLVKVSGADGVRLDTDTFELLRNGKATVRVRAAAPPKAPPTVTAPGLWFDGDAVVEIPSLSRDAHTPITIEALLTLTGLKGGVVVRVEGKAGCQLYGWPNQTVPEPRWVPNVLDFRGKFGGDAAGVGPGRAFHLSMQLDEATAELFLDGKKVRAEKRAGTGTPGKLTGTYLGGQVDVPGGRVRDGVAAVLHGVRVTAGKRYAADYAPPARFAADPGTLALYHFSDGAGATLTDATGNRHHGTIRGATWVRP